MMRFMSTPEPHDDRPLVLLLLAGGDAGRAFHLKRHTLIIGRDPACDIHIDDRRVSRQHARIEPEPDGGLLLVDNGSANGTYVNGEPIASCYLDIGDRIGLGKGIQLVVAPCGSLHERAVAFQRATASHQTAAAIGDHLHRILARNAGDPTGILDQIRAFAASLQPVDRTGIEEVELGQLLVAVERQIGDPRLTMDAEPDLVVRAHPRLLQQALTEALRISLDAAEGPVLLEAQPYEPDERAIRKKWLGDLPYVRIGITDRGPTPLAERPLELFPPSGTRGYGSVHAIVQAFDGLVDAHTEEERTTVEIFLQLVSG